ncbi:MAG TPA: hypothetical protein PLI95_12365 [Polyangiaceae bacterium]|nr:hypothetical protein [Polyangiaceae bacterium]
MRSRLISLLLCCAPLPLMLAPGACGQPPPSHAPAGCNRSAASSIASSSPSAASSSADVPPDAGLPHPFDRGCAQDLDPSASPSARLDTAGRTCAPGMLPVLAPTAFNASPEVAASARVDLAAHACVRVGAASDAAIALDVGLRGPDASPIGSGRGPGLLLLRESGPICVRDKGTYSVEARPHARATVWIAVWAANPIVPASP